MTLTYDPEQDLVIIKGEKWTREGIPDFAEMAAKKIDNPNTPSLWGGLEDHFPTSDGFAEYAYQLGRMHALKEAHIRLVVKNDGRILGYLNHSDWGVDIEARDKHIFWLNDDFDDLLIIENKQEGLVRTLKLESMEE